MNDLNKQNIFVFLNKWWFLTVSILILLIALIWTMMFSSDKKYYYSTHGNAQYYYLCNPNLKNQVMTNIPPKHLKVRNNCL